MLETMAEVHGIVPNVRRSGKLLHGSPQFSCYIFVLGSAASLRPCRWPSRTFNRSSKLLHDPAAIAIRERLNVPNVNRSGKLLHGGVAGSSRQTPQVPSVSRSGKLHYKINYSVVIPRSHCPNRELLGRCLANIPTTSVA